MKDFTEGVDFRFLVNAKEALHFDFKQYNQVFMDRHGFIQNLSTLDLLFNEGPGTITHLKAQSLENPC